jgi:hypothetical protein
MKVAVEIYGYMRTFAQTVNSIKDHIVIPLNADIFISTYNTYFGQKDTDPHNSLEHPGNLTADQLQFPLYPYLKEFIVERHDIDHYQREINRMKLPEFNHMGGPNWRSLSMHDSFRKVIRLRQKYEQENNIKYDAVILMRPDLMIAKKIEISNLDLNKVHYNPSHSAPVLGTNKFFGDHIMISCPENIDKLSCLYDKVAEYYKEGIAINNETLIAFCFMKHNIEFEKSEFTYHGVVR